MALFASLYELVKDLLKSWDNFNIVFIDSFFSFIKESNSLSLKSISSNESWNKSLFCSNNLNILLVKDDIIWDVFGLSIKSNFFFKLGSSNQNLD